MNLGFYFIFSPFFGQPMAYGGPQPGTRSEPQSPPMLELRQRQILYPTVPGWGSNLLQRCHRSHRTTVGTPSHFFYNLACLT